MYPVLIDLSRYVLRDLEEKDRPDFVQNQLDPRYLALYDFSPNDHARAEQLFELFISWQEEKPRTNYQLAVCERRSRKLLGNVGLRFASDGVALLGIELAPSEWGRFRLAIDVIDATLSFGFERLQLETIRGETASGNKRIEKLAKRYGARIVSHRPGPPWMEARGWQEMDWELSRSDWLGRSGRH